MAGSRVAVRADRSNVLVALAIAGVQARRTRWAPAAGAALAAVLLAGELTALAGGIAAIISMRHLTRSRAKQDWANFDQMVH